VQNDKDGVKRKRTPAQESGIVDIQVLGNINQLTHDYLCSIKLKYQDIIYSLKNRRFNLYE